MADTVFRIRARDATGKATQGATKNFAGVTGGLGGMATAGLAAGAALAGLAAVTLTDLIGDLEKSEQTIARITGLTGPDVAPWSELAAVIGGDVPQGLDLVSQAVGTAVNRFGEADTAIEALAREALALNEIFGVEVRPTIQDVTDASRLFGETTGGQVKDNLADLGIVALKLDVDLGQLIGDISTYGPVLTQFGLGFDESASFLGLLSSAGIDASRVFPGLNMFLRQLAEEGITDTKGALIGAIAAIKGATTETEALDLATQLFGAEGAVRLVEAIRGTGEAGGVLGAMDQWVAGMSTDPDSLINVIGLADNSVQQFAADTRTSTDQMTIAWNRFKLAFRDQANDLRSEGAATFNFLAVLGEDSNAAWAFYWTSRRDIALRGGEAVINAFIGMGEGMVNAGVDAWNTININARAGLNNLLDGLRGFSFNFVIPPIKVGDIFSFGGYRRTFRPFSGVGSVSRSGGGLNRVSFDRVTLGPSTQDLLRELRQIAANSRSSTLRAVVGIDDEEPVVPVAPTRATVPFPIDPRSYLEPAEETTAPGTQIVVNVELTGDTYGLENLDDRVIEAVQEGIRQGELQLN